jgi:hypothetical protein
LLSGVKASRRQADCPRPKKSKSHAHCQNVDGKENKEREKGIFWGRETRVCGLSENFDGQ